MRTHTCETLIQKAHHHSILLMGCHFVLTAVDDDPQRAWDGIRAGVAEVERIERLISSWRNDSETALINHNAGIKPTRVSRELFNLIERSIRISKMTGGAFDISGSLARYYWSFDKGEHQWLDEDKIQELRDMINYNLIELDSASETVFLRKKGMKIGFGGIGKGYAAEQASNIMLRMGIQSGLINASGDLQCWGHPPQAKDWNITIPNPDNRSMPLYTFGLPYGSVVSSGNFENYTLIQGKRYSHIIDPRTARPIEDVKQVSVICLNAELADALATGLTVLGVEAGLKLVNRLNGVECMIIDKNDKPYFSDKLQSLLICQN